MKLSRTSLLALSLFLLLRPAIGQVKTIMLTAGSPEDQASTEIDKESDPPKKIAMLNDFVQKFNVGYPVGWTDREKVLNFLGISGFERFVVPQMVWIDRKGMVRAKTLPSGTDTDQRNEPYWRQMIETLTKEAGGTAKSPAHHALHTARK